MLLVVSVMGAWPYFFYFFLSPPPILTKSCNSFVHIHTWLLKPNLFYSSWIPHFENQLFLIYIQLILNTSFQVLLFLHDLVYAFKLTTARIRRTQFFQTVNGNWFYVGPEKSQGGEIKECRTTWAVCLISLWNRSIRVNCLDFCKKKKIIFINFF